MKKLLCSLFLLAAASVFAAPQVTVFGKSQYSFRNKGLQVNAFYCQKGVAESDVAKIVKAINNSKLVVVADSIAACNNIFSNAAIKNALTDFFKNGGTFFLWVPSWSWMNKRPIRLYGYFNYCKVFLPVGFKGFGKGKRVQAAIKDGFAGSWVMSPNKDFKLTTPGANNLPLRGDWQILAAAPDDTAVLLMQEKVHGNGRVIVSYVPVLYDKNAAPFIDNMVNNIYGNLLKK